MSSSIEDNLPSRTSAARERIREAGLRATASRIAVLELLMVREQPMSHGEVAEALGEVAWDRTTLYRNLVDLAEAGILHRTELGDRLWRFALVDADHHHHGDEDHHPHFLCTECGAVACLPDVALPSSGMPLAVQNGEVEIQIRGRCDQCRG